MRILRLTIAALLVTIALTGLVLWVHLQGWLVPRLPPRALSATLRPHDHVFVPDGTGPFPIVLAFHGCGGLHDDGLRAMEQIRDWGYAVLAVDSLAPRGIAPGPTSSMCLGARPLGAERAGDVLVTLEHARTLPFVDAERMALLGWSHGAWALMELLAFDPPRRLPPGLQSSAGRGLAGVRGVVLFYPYCGYPSRGFDWAPKVPTLFLLAGADAIADPDDCTTTARAQRAAGHPVEVRVFEGVGHAFDESAPWGGPNPTFDAAATAQAYGHVRRLLREVLGPGSEQRVEVAFGQQRHQAAQQPVHQQLTALVGHVEEVAPRHPAVEDEELRELVVAPAGLEVVVADSARHERVVIPPK